MSLFEKINISKNYLENIFKPHFPRIAIQTGTGMTAGFPELDVIREVFFKDIPHFVISTAPSHRGSITLCSWKNIEILILNGRFHYYEGYSMQEVVYPVYVLKSLGIENLILTNASGSINPHIKDGALVNISDHINLHHDNPLRGPNDERIGPRFPNMSNAYDAETRDVINVCAKNLEIEISDGVYLGLAGPNFETPSEYKMARLIGADIVGMSTVPEIIAANHCGLRANAISIVSNQFDPQNEHKGSDLEEVITNVNANSDKLMRLVLSVVENINQKFS